MKSLSFILFALSIIVFTSCSNVGGSKNVNTTSEIKGGIVNQINTPMFKTLIYNYEKNPNAWLYEGSQPCIIDFYADWCRPCKMVAPIMEELATQYKGKVTFYKMNIDQEKELAQTFNIQSIPAILYIPVKGQPQMSAGLFSKDSYIQQIQSLLLKPQASN
jgi:thioredoxin 1